MKLPCSLIVVGLAVATSGCIEEPTGESATLPGRYSLTQVAGAPLPLVTYEARLSQAKLEVIGAEYVALSRSRMLDIVEYRATTELGVVQAPYKDTLTVTYELDGSTMTITRERGSAAPIIETWALADGVMSGSRSFKNTIGLMVGPFSALYTTAD